MATRVGGGLLVLAALASVPGCGTVLSFQQEEEGPRAYGGVRMDAALGPGLIAAGVGALIYPKEHEKFPPGTYISLGACALADLPFSLVADTVTLPLTVPVALRKVGGKPHARTEGEEVEGD